MTFADRFKQLRLEKGLTQQELANDFNRIHGYTITKSSISQYEHSKRVPEYKPLQAFAIYFNVSIDYLVGLSDIRNLNSLFSDSDIMKGLESIFNNDSISRLEKDILLKDIFDLYFNSVR